MGVFLLFCLLLIAWGWTALILWGVRIIVRDLRRADVDNAWRKRPYVVALLLFLIAFGWQRVTAPLNFGRTLGTIITADGQKQGVIRQASVVGYNVIVNSDQFSLRGHSRPSEVFWMRDGEAIGVIYKDRPPLVLEIALQEKYLKSRHIDLTPEQLEKLHMHRALSAEELRELEVERQLATERGLIWIDE